MAFLNTTDLKQYLPNWIEPYTEERIDNVAYELSLGDQVFLTDSKTGEKTTLTGTDNHVSINPGQFALLLTKETVTIPEDKLAFISIKAGEKFKGLVNVSGFHVDPGFSGKLLFSVYNAGPSIIMLEMGKPYFPIWFAELKGDPVDTDAYNAISNSHQNQSSIPLKYIEVLKRGDLASPNALLTKIKEVDIDLNDKLKDVDRRKLKNEWLISILIGAVITVLIRVFWEHNAFVNIEEKVKNEVNKAKIELSIDSLVSTKVDSVLRIKEAQEQILIPTKRK